MPDYNILARIKIDPASVQADLNKISQTAMINVKAKITGGDKLTTTLGKVDNQLERLKINNKDAFNNSDLVKRELVNVEKLRTGLEKGTVSIGQYTNGYGKLSNAALKYNKEVTTNINNTDNFATSITKVIGKIALWQIGTLAIFGSLRKLQEGIQYVKDLNQEITNIGLVSGQTTDKLSGMANQFNDMAKELGATTLDMAEGATTWINI